MVFKELKIINIPVELVQYLGTYYFGRKKALKLLKKIKTAGYTVMIVVFFLLFFRMPTGAWKYELLGKAFLIAVFSTEAYCWRGICSIPSWLMKKKLEKQIPEFGIQPNTLSVLNNLFILRKKAYIDKNCTVIREMFLFSDAKFKLYLKWKNQKGIFKEKTYLFEVDRIMICETEAVPVYDAMNNYLKIPASYFIESIIGRKEKK